jgi:hypothetical protein
MNSPRSPKEALTLALFLAITAPTEAQAAQAVALAVQIAETLNPADVAAAKRNAARRAKRWEAT